MTARLSLRQVEMLAACYRRALSQEQAAITAGVSQMTTSRYFRAFRAEGVVQDGVVQDGVVQDTDPSCGRVCDADVPVHVIADRDRRAELSPASLVAAIAGDPLPGYSALDARRQQTTDTGRFAWTR